MNLEKTLVIGNSGSGKSWLAEQLAMSLASVWVDLDLLHWEPGGYNVSRERAEAIAMAHAAATADRWVIEGIYGWIVSEILPAATALIWLSVDEPECVANIHQRGMRRGANVQSFAELSEWANTYRSRDGSSAYRAHESIFNAFPRDKRRLASREQITAFARRFTAD